MKYLAVALLFAMNSDVYACEWDSSFGFYKRIPDKSVLVYQDELLKRIAKYDTHGYLHWYEMFYGGMTPRIARLPKTQVSIVISNQSNHDPRPKDLIGAYYDLQSRQDEPDRRQLTDQHSLTPSEREDILLLINLVIDDNTKANQILDELYAQYRQNLANTQVIHNDFRCIVSADVWHGDIKFRFEGFVPNTAYTDDGIIWFEIR